MFVRFDLHIYKVFLKGPISDFEKSVTIRNIKYKNLDFMHNTAVTHENKLRLYFILFLIMLSKD